VDKNALEQLLSSYNWWMGVSTIAVALGILGEYVAHFIFEEEARRNKREMAISILFGALVLGGVVGEYVFGKRLTQVSEQLQQIADEAVAQSNKDAAQARRDAETAKGDAAKADEKAGKANERASANEQEAQQLKSENLKLEAIIQPRGLSPTQSRETTDRMRAFTGRELSIRSYVLDIEAKRLGIVIKSSLERAGLRVVDNLGTVVNLKGKIVEGIELRGPEHSQDDLINALLDSPLAKDRRLRMTRNPVAGLTGYFGDEILENPGVYSGTRAEIFIGLKPMPEAK